VTACLLFDPRDGLGVLVPRPLLNPVRPFELTIWIFAFFRSARSLLTMSEELPSLKSSISFSPAPLRRFSGSSSGFHGKAPREVPSFKLASRFSPHTVLGVFDLLALLLQTAKASPVSENPPLDPFGFPLRDKRNLY